MKIRSLFFLSAFFVGVCCLTSCEEGTTNENADELASIYWNKSAAFQLHLKGKVKTMVTDDSITTTTFNQSGNIISYISNVDNQENQKLITYSNGKLTREIYSWSMGAGINADTTSYTYGTFGKYLPITENSGTEMHLVRNIAGINGNMKSTRFVASGDSIWMISSYSRQNMNMIYAQEENADTTSLTFNGGLFPVTMRSKYIQCSFTYASDGRVLTSEVVYSGLSSTVTTFKSDCDYLLPISVEYKQGGEIFSAITYSYNENGDIIGKVGAGLDEEYSDYVYDAKGNWISRSYRSKVDSAVLSEIWNDKVTQPRHFTYWE